MSATNETEPLDSMWWFPDDCSLRFSVWRMRDMDDYRFVEAAVSQVLSVLKKIAEQRESAPDADASAPTQEDGVA